jgi:hypothetical protein
LSSSSSSSSSSIYATTTTTTTTNNNNDEKEKKEEENKNNKLVKELSDKLVNWIQKDEAYRVYFGPHVLCRDYLRFFDVTSEDTRHEFLQIINNDYFPFLLDEYIQNNPYEKEDNRDKFESSSVRDTTVLQLYGWLVDEILKIREENKTSKFKKMFGDNFAYYCRKKMTT